MSLVIRKHTKIEALSGQITMIHQVIQELSGNKVANTKVPPYKSYFLKDFSIWVVIKCSFAFLFLVSAQSPQGPINYMISEVLSGLFGFMFVGLFGAVASSIPLISFGAIATYIFLLVSLASKQAAPKNRAKKALWVIFGLSMFTLWVEPFLTIFSVGGVVGKIVEAKFAVFFLIFDPFISAIWLFLTVTVVRKISVETQTISPPSASLTNTQTPEKRPARALLLSFIGGGYFYLTQTGKGLILVAVLLMSMRQPMFFFPVYLLSIIDTNRLTARYNQHQTIGKWSICWNPYTVCIACTVGFMIGAIFSP
ncbi:MAG: hypothetical protein HC800_05085 [Phormidesmis sp. RL_2_1]|nr:hypothetical protein [Phormidesmis sp. RL_2_1]